MFVFAHVHIDRTFDRSSTMIWYYLVMLFI